MTRRATKHLDQVDAPAPIEPCGPSGVKLTSFYAFYEDDGGPYRQWTESQIVTDPEEAAMLRQRCAPVEDFFETPEPPLGPCTGAKLTAPFSFIDADGTHRAWVAGLLITDPAEIEMLRQRGAPVADFYGETSGMTPGFVMPVVFAPKPSRRQALQQQYLEIKAKHGTISGVIAILDERISIFDHQFNTWRYELAHHYHFDPKAKARIISKQEDAFREIENFFAGWLVKSDKNARKEGEVAQAEAISRQPAAVAPADPEPEVVIDRPSTERTTLSAYREAVEKHKADRRVTYLLDVRLAALKQRLGGYQATLGRGMSCPAAEAEQAEAAKALDLAESERFFMKWLRRSGDMASRQIILEGGIY